MSKELFKKLIDDTVANNPAGQSEALKQIIAQKAAEIVSREKEKPQE